MNRTMEINNRAMEINKERIEKLADLMFDGFNAALAGDNENIKVTPTEFTIALAAASREVLLNFRDIIRVRKMLDITDELLLEAFGSLVRFSIDENFELAQKNDQE